MDAEEELAEFVDDVKQAVDDLLTALQGKTGCFQQDGYIITVERIAGQ